MSIDYIYEPGRPALDLLSVLHIIPRELNDFYFRLLTEVREDNNDFNSTIKLRAIKCLLHITLVNVSLRSKYFIRYVLCNTAYKNEDVNVDNIRAACHHLITWDELGDAFKLGHFSVVEFFNANSPTNKHRLEISNEFKSSAL